MSGLEAPVQSYLGSLPGGEGCLRGGENRESSAQVRWKSLSSLKGGRHKHTGTHNPYCSGSACSGSNLDVGLAPCEVSRCHEVQQG